MANERIEIDVVLADGSVAQAFASIPKAAQNAAKKAQGSFDGIEKELKGFSSGLDKIKSSFVALGAAIGIGYGINKLAGFIGDAVAEANEGEVALNNLANSLRSAGSLSEDAVNSFKDFADQVQRTTTISDDQVLSLSALARNYARTNEETIKLTKAAIQLSAATGVDLNSAVDQLGGTLNGIPGRLGKVIPGFKGLSEEALKSGQALDLVLERFGGSAESKINTYAGSIAQLKNEFSNFLEDIGNLIIRSPALTAVLSETAAIFREFALSFGSIKKSNQDVLGPVISQIIEFGLVFNQYVIYPFELWANGMKVVFNVVKLQFNALVASIGQVAGAIGKVISYIDKDNSIAENLMTFADSSKSQFVSQIGKVGESAANLFDTSFSSNVESTLSRIQQRVQEASKELREEVKVENVLGSQSGNVLPPIDQEALTYQVELAKIKSEAVLLRYELEGIGESDIFGSFKQQLDALPDAISIANAKTQTAAKEQVAQLKAVREEVNATSQSMATAINNGVANAISSGIQAAVSAFVTGKNAFKAFVAAVLGSFGDLAIQIGTTLISIGLGIDSLKIALATLSGGTAIAAGIALVAVGSLLKSLSGGLGAAPTPAGSSVTAPGTPATPISASDNLDENRRATVNLKVEGNVYDPQGTGLAIADLLKAAGFDGALVT